MNNDPSKPQFDALVVGAGFAGLYMLKRLRDYGLSAVGIEAAEEVGGTWFWNRYPGARCDLPTTDYTFSWDPDLETEWQWSEKYATQPEIFRYLQYVASKHDLRRDIRFSTRVMAATWNDDLACWAIQTDHGDTVTARHLVMASGVLSVPKAVDIAGAQRFAGEVYFTSSWPAEAVDFTGKRVAVIGTGSTGIQAIPLIAEQAAELLVFQRTPNFSVPANNGPAPAERLEQLRTDPAGYRKAARESRNGIVWGWPELRADQLSPEQQRARFEEALSDGVELAGIQGVFADQIHNRAANEIVAEFVRERIRSVVRDPEVAAELTPTDHPIATKRPTLSTNYYETYNRPNVRLVNVRKTPISTITETGIATATETFDVDVIVYATGFDAMTGAITAVNIESRGTALADLWNAEGSVNYLGLMVAGFPNIYTITGPGSPSVQAVMTASIEQHVEWVSDRIFELKSKGYNSIEPTETAQQGWVQHVNDCAEITLYPEANSWYMGANVPGKPRVFMPYVGGLDLYRSICDEAVARDYLGFILSGPAGTHCSDGVVMQLQPDVFRLLEGYNQLGAEPVEAMTPAAARQFVESLALGRPRGPKVGEVSDGVLAGPSGDLRYRVYRPESTGPHAITVYFPGGGWVFGDLDSDDPLCRDLCARTDSVVVSVDYRHAPESPYPAAVDDAFAATAWIAARAQELGGEPGQLRVAGWSAGANLAAVVARRARDNDGPAIASQLLFNPVTRADLDTDSYRDNGDGYILTSDMMAWFLDHYVPDAQRRLEPDMAPARTPDLAGLPPAVLVTAQFDPLRDEGHDYAVALENAGVPTVLIEARGHIHSSVVMVDQVYSGVPVRERAIAALRELESSVVGV